MSIRLIQPDAYAALGEVWLDDQLARLAQKSMQFGGHYRIDTDALLNRLARAATAMAMPVAAGEPVRRTTLGAAAHARRPDNGCCHAAEITVNA